MERTVTRTRNDTADDVVVLADATAPRSRIRWAAVFAGMVLSVGLLVLLSSLWLAIAYGSDEPSSCETSSGSSVPARSAVS